MLKRFLIAIRKPIILSRGTLMLENSEYIKEEERLTNILMRRVVILRLTGSEVVVPLDGMYKKVRSINSNTKGFKIPDTWRGGFITPPNNLNICKCYDCFKIEVVHDNHRGRSCSRCGGRLIPTREIE